MGRIGSKSIRGYKNSVVKNPLIYQRIFVIICLLNVREDDADDCVKRCFANGCMMKKIEDDMQNNCNVVLDKGHMNSGFYF